MNTNVLGYKYLIILAESSHRRRDLLRHSYIPFLAPSATTLSDACLFRPCLHVDPITLGKRVRTGHFSNIWPFNRWRMSGVVRSPPGPKGAALESPVPEEACNPLRGPSRSRTVSDNPNTNIKLGDTVSQLMKKLYIPCHNTRRGCIWHTFSVSLLSGRTHGRSSRLPHPWRTAAPCRSRQAAPGARWGKSITVSKRQNDIARPTRRGAYL